MQNKELNWTETYSKFIEIISFPTKTKEQMENDKIDLMNDTERNAVAVERYKKLWKIQLNRVLIKLAKSNK